MVQANQKITRERRKELRGRLNELIGKHHRTLYVSAFLSWIQFLMRVLSFGLIAKTFEQLYLQQPIQLSLLLLQLLSLNLIGFAVAILAKQCQGVVSQYARNRLKHHFFEVFQARQGEFESNVSVADVLTVASQGIDSLDTYFNLYKTISLRAFVNCATVLIIVAVLFPLGGILFLISLPFIPVSILLIQKRSKQIMQRYWASYMDVGNLFMDDLKGMNTLYAYQADERYEQSFIEQAEDFRLVTMELLKFQLQSVGYMDAVMYLGVGVSGFFAVQQWFSGNLSLFTVILFVLIAAEFFAPIRELGYCMHLLMMNTKMADRIFSFLDMAHKAEDFNETVAIEDTIQELTLSHVNFYYNDLPILADVSVTVRKGEICAVAGESGRGKTTLARLLMGHERATSGDIYLGKIPLNNLSKETLSQKIVLVSPESYVFNQSIYENLVMGNDMSRTEVETWLLDQRILPFIQYLPEGLDTLCGENGSQLSPGQRQQLLCARALLSKRDVYIFDEMTSSIDSENEQAIFDLVRLTARDAIVLFISHKMKQVQEADKVLFLGEECHMQVGTPTDLLTSNPAYRELVNTQTELEAILDA